MHSRARGCEGKEETKDIMVVGVVWIEWSCDYGGITWVVMELFWVHSFEKGSQEPSELNSSC